MAVDNIIFDLGGVILNIDYSKTVDAFKKLGGSTFDSLFTQANQTDLFDKYEKGQCSSQFFINGLLDYLPSGTAPNSIVNAWNAMLLDLPQQRIVKLLDIKEKYRTFLLSNTNDIHLNAFHSIIKKENNLESLNPLFEKVYFSCEMKMRKPDPEIFLTVCDENNLEVKKTLFIDDSIQHVEGAKRAGLQAYHLTNGETILDLDFL
jgi:haloacid dehalogenase superfamily, subfamily IA, variant 3 with third motif having DD or ED